MFYTQFYLYQPQTCYAGERHIPLKNYSLKIENLIWRYTFPETFFKYIIFRNTCVHHIHRKYQYCIFSKIYSVNVPTHWPKAVPHIWQNCNRIISRMIILQKWGASKMSYPRVLRTSGRWANSYFQLFRFTKIVPYTQFNFDRNLVNFKCSEVLQNLQFLFVQIFLWVVEPFTNGSKCTQSPNWRNSDNGRFSIRNTVTPSS